MDLFPSFLSNMFGRAGSPSMPFGYSGLTPDQLQQQQQQGWYANPDMVLPTGSTQQQMFPTQGYSGLTPAQASTVNSLGYYTSPDATGSSTGGMFSDLIKKLGSGAGADALKGLANTLQPPRQNTAATPSNPYGDLSRLLAHTNPYFNIYTRSPITNRQQVLTQLQQGHV